MSLINFRNFFIPYVFEVKKSISRGFTKLPCSGDLENLGQLPVLEVPQGTLDLVLWISVISTFLTTSMSRNLFFVVLHCCSVQVTSKTQINFRFCRNSRVLTIGSYGFSKCLRSLRYPSERIHFSQFHEATVFG